MDIEVTRLRRLLDRGEISETLHRYVRGVDRGDWTLVRSTYHPDATDDHVEYRGDVDGLIAWLSDRFAGVDNSVHFLGSSLVEFVGEDVALVETYFVSSRLRPPNDTETAQTAEGDAWCRQSWGRYVDRFERREGVWRVATRTVLVDARFTSVAVGGARVPGRSWGMRDGSDPLFAARTAHGLEG
jgi:hypothetical protein